MQEVEADPPDHRAVCFGQAICFVGPETGEACQRSSHSVQLMGLEGGVGGFGLSWDSACSKGRSHGLSLPLWHDWLPTSGCLVWWP